jgi:hypothetical protein
MVAPKKEKTKYLTLIELSKIIRQVADVITKCEDLMLIAISNNVDMKKEYLFITSDIYCNSSILGNLLIDKYTNARQQKEDKVTFDDKESSKIKIVLDYMKELEDVQKSIGRRMSNGQKYKFN